LRKTKFKNIKLSLADFLGVKYVDASASARARLGGEPRENLSKLGREKVEFFSEDLQEKLVSMLADVGKRVIAPLKNSPRGAPPAMFAAATKKDATPLSGLGYYRIGESGRLYFISKSEHYHTPLGHAFPGYKLIDNARRLGIPNATHNNTRGMVTRILERELVRTANSIAGNDRAGLEKALETNRAGVLNRVLNLETGSLAVEAGIKMMLSRFYKVQGDSSKPKYSGRTPVIVVMGDTDGGRGANYHGTTLITQLFRGMWPALYSKLEKQGILKVVPVRPNDHAQLDAVFQRYNTGRYKMAGFLYEIILMNYGGLKLTKKFVKRIHALCRLHDTPTLVDEIQTCVWRPEHYMFLEYGVRPTFVAVGKGFPGGEFAASRIIFNSSYDYLPQFGALVTNGQEELASLAYLITMRWTHQNRAITRSVGEYYETKLKELARNYPRILVGIEGSRHLASIYFHKLRKARDFVALLVGGGIDISVQTYKASCPPSALTKLPLIAGYEAVDMLISRMETALKKL